MENSFNVNQGINVGREIFFNPVELQIKRIYLGISVKEAAENLNISKRYWNYWEQGIKRMDPRAFILLDRLCLFVKKASESYIAEDFKIPLFRKYQTFHEAFPLATTVKWRIWQKIISNIYHTHKNIVLTDIPDDSNIFSKSVIFLKFNEFYDLKFPS